MTPADDDKTSGEIEREVESTRARVSQTLDELRDRMSPENVVDDLMSYASGGGEILNSVGKIMRENPLPVLLIGAGIAWLVTSNAAPRRPDYRRRLEDGYRDAEGYASQGYRRAEDMASRGYRQAEGYASQGYRRAEELASRGYRQAGDIASRVGERVGDKASSLAETVGETASSVYGDVADVAGRAASKVGEVASSLGHEASRYASDASHYVSDMGDRAYRSVRGRSGGIMELIEEQPLVLGAVGLAIGVAIGMALPGTQTEDDWLGDRADALKRQAMDLGQESYDTAKAAALRAYEDAKKEAEAQGFTTGALGEVAGVIGERISSVAEAAKEAVQETVESRTGSKG